MPKDVRPERPMMPLPAGLAGTQPTAHPPQTAAAPGLPQLIAELTEIVHGFHRNGWSQATSTNYSFRAPGAPDACIISASGIDKSTFAATDLMAVDMLGQPLPPGSLPGFAQPATARPPSAETLIHTTLYTQNPAIQAVLHTHSVAGTVLSMRHAALGAVCFRGLEMQKGIRGVATHEGELALRIFPNTQDMRALSQALAASPAPQAEWGLLLAGHGLYAWGTSLAEAKRHIETWEFLMACALWM